MPASRPFHDEIVRLVRRIPRGKVATYGQIAAMLGRPRAARAVGSALRKLGVRPGDVVSWQLPNWVESVALAAAIDRLGAISSPIIPIYREREVRFDGGEHEDGSLGPTLLELASVAPRVAPELVFGYHMDGCAKATREFNRVAILDEQSALADR